MIEQREAFQVAREWPHELPPWANADPHPPQNFPQITQQAIDVYIRSQGPRGGIQGIGWWQWANGYTAIALHDYWSGTNHNYERLADALHKCEGQHARLINEFNDDTLWFGLCCVHVFNIGGDPWFLEKAKGIWHHIVREKKRICGRQEMQCCEMDMEGGCLWTTKPDEGYLNAITTGFVAELSVRLALIEGGGSGSGEHRERHPHLSKLQNMLGGGGGGGPGASGDEYLETARCSLGWILRCVYRPKDAVVMDGIRTRKNEVVDWTFTYNTGVAMGVAALMYEATREEDYMILACHMAHRAMRRKGWGAEDGVMRAVGEWGKAEGEPMKNGDGVGFKSVLIRQMGTLYEVIMKTRCESQEARRTAELIRKYINLNFRSQVNNNTNGNGQYGPWWAGPFECPTSHSQMAVLDVMAAVMLVNRG